MMKTVFSTSISARVSSAVFALAVGGMVCAASAFAQDNGSYAPIVQNASAPRGNAQMGRIAVVDLEFLVATSKAGKSIRSQLDQQRKVYAGQIDRQEGELRTAEKNLIADKPKLSKDDFDKESKDFRDKVVRAQQDVQQHRMTFDKAYTSAMEKLREYIVKIVADIAGKNGIALVLNRQEVVLVDAKMDLTRDVLSALDAKVTSIPVSIGK